MATTHRVRTRCHLYPQASKFVAFPTFHLHIMPKSGRTKGPVWNKRIIKETEEMNKAQELRIKFRYRKED